MTIVLCDDQAVYLEQAEPVLEEYGRETGRDYIIKTFTDSVELCEQNEIVPDILFLDIRMDVQDGIETAEKINRKWPACRIIYLTDYLSYAVDVYQTEHIYYVLKSQLKDRIGQVMEKVLSDIATDERRLVFRKGKKNYVLQTGEILYFERSLRTTIIKTREENFEVEEKLSEVERKLPEKSFIRCHQSYLVATAAIRRLDRETLEVVNGDVIPVSRRYQKEVKIQFAMWLARHGS